MTSKKRWPVPLVGIYPALTMLGGLMTFPAVGLAQEATADFTPANIKSAYNFTSLPSTVNGSGQTIAIIDFGNDTLLSSDVAGFDSQFGFTAPNLVVESETGSTTSLEPNNNTSDTQELSSDQETALDVEFAHSLAPQANIVVVELPPIDTTLTVGDFESAANSAASKGSVVSLSIGIGTGSFETQIDPTLNHSGVSFVAATGDTGNLGYPATSPNALAVGGTSLSLTGRTNPNTTASAGGIYTAEVVWNDGPNSSGGGVDSNEPQPLFQKGASGVSGTLYRNVPDVAYDADPNTGEIDYFDGILGVVGGTSIGAPQWAALLSLADQLRATNDLQPLTTGSPTSFTSLVSPTGSNTNLQDMLYSVYDYDQPLYDLLFHQITSGSNSSGDAANPNGGYSDVTGLGTPNAALLVDYLGGLPVSVPEPSTCALLAVGAATLLTRRRTRRTQLRI